MVAGRARSSGATRDMLRRHNLSTVLRGVHLRGAMSRSALTTETGLNRSTIAALVTELVDFGLVVEAEPESTGEAGRPSPMVTPTDAHVVAIGVDVASQWIRVGVGGIGGRLSIQLHHEVDNDGRPYADTLDHLTDLLSTVRGQLHPGQHLVAVGVAAPGVVRTHDGFVHLAPNVDWHDAPLGTDLADRLGGDVAVRVANEAHLGAMAEHTRGAGVGVTDLVYLSGEIGVGGGVISDGRLHLGADGYSAEIGHVPVTSGPEATRCRCGALGCLEAEAGELALLRLAGQAARPSLSRAVAEVVARAEAGDATAVAALVEVGHRLGRGIAGMVNLLNPRRVVIGGYFAEVFGLLEGPLGEELDARTLAPHLASLTVVPAALGDSSALIGAVELALDPLVADPASSPVRRT